MTDAELPVEQRILQLFEHLGISQAHVASRMPQDWEGFVTTYPERPKARFLLPSRSIAQLERSRSRKCTVNPAKWGPTKTRSWRAEKAFDQCRCG